MVAIQLLLAPCCQHPSQCSSTLYHHLGAPRVKAEVLLSAKRTTERDSQSHESITEPGTLPQQMPKIQPSECGMSSSASDEENDNSLLGSGEITKQACEDKKWGNPNREVSFSTSTNSTCETHDLIQRAASADVVPEPRGTGTGL